MGKCEGYEKFCSNEATTTFLDQDKPHQFCDDCNTRLHAKRETIVGVAFPAADWMTEELVMEQWKQMLDGFDGEPIVERIGDEFDMRACFYNAEVTDDGVRFAVFLEKLLGKKVTLSSTPRTN